MKAIFIILITIGGIFLLGALVLIFIVVNPSNKTVYYQEKFRRGKRK